MRHITKGSTPQTLVAWKRTFYQNQRRRAGYDDIYDYPSVQRDLKQALLNEQHYICCYCGNAIDLTTMHVEHFKPQGRFRNDQLNYRNLLASCIARRHHEPDLSCGHKKDDWFHPSLLISPIDEPYCGDLFRFKLDGRIESAAETGTEDWLRANETIERLELNAHRLVLLRKVVIDDALNEDRSPLSHSEIIRRISDYETPDSNGRLKRFCFAAVYQLRKEL
jgi:uncharacterized protein (TIGR02646 family)